MKTILISIIGTGLLALWTLPVQAQTVTEDQAFTVAQNWVTLILQKKGKWGESKTAEVQDIQEFRQGERVLGYFCRVRPKGCVVISLRKEMSPIQAYSDTHELDPGSEEGIMALIKEGMEQSFYKIETLAESIPPPSSPGDWATLGSDVGTFAAGLESIVEPPAYQPNTYLLTSNWQQGNPYNCQCPSGDGCSNTKVGCVALAGAQIMRYWAWPPGYDWVNMPDSLTGATQAQIDAVAQLCADVGWQAGTSYGCLESTAWCADNKFGKDMLDAFEDHYQYNQNADFDIRADNSSSGWYSMIKDNINQNRPLQYATAKVKFPGVAGHSMVLDGWEETGGVLKGHMNDGNLAWVPMTNIAGIEGMIKNIYPVNSLGGWLSGSPDDANVLYGVPGSTYRYFDQDAAGRNVTFSPGQNLQFLAGVRVRGTSPVGDCIQFTGSSNYPTRMFSIKGTATGGSSAGIQLNNGGILLYNNGSIRFH
jgi:hypothetical protein